jgi:hypothetical protein
MDWWCFSFNSFLPAVSWPGLSQVSLLRRFLDSCSSTALLFPYLFPLASMLCNPVVGAIVLSLWDLIRGAFFSCLVSLLGKG